MFADTDSPYLDPSDDIEIAHHRLPHWQQSGKCYFVTWRLGDALPQEVLARWRHERACWLHAHPKPWSKAIASSYRERFVTPIEHWLDQGIGECYLRRSECSQIVASSLFHFDHKRYDMFSFVVMPNHVHALFRLFPEEGLKEVMQSWKGYSARLINKIVGRRGALWQEDYWDRMIRDDEHFSRCVDYIRENARSANLLESSWCYYLWDENGGLESPPSQRVAH